VHVPFSFSQDWLDLPLSSNLDARFDLPEERLLLEIMVWVLVPDFIQLLQPNSDLQQWIPENLVRCAMSFPVAEILQVKNILKPTKNS
jgi:hypothetical protein